VYMVTPAQLMANLCHLFLTHELCPLQLLFKELQSASFRLSKTVLLAYLVQMAGTGDF